MTKWLQHDYEFVSGRCVRCTDLARNDMTDKTPDQDACACGRLDHPSKQLASQPASHHVAAADMLHTCSGCLPLQDDTARGSVETCIHPATNAALPYPGAHLQSLRSRVRQAHQHASRRSYADCRAYRCSTPPRSGYTTGCIVARAEHTQRACSACLRPQASH
jgi:hypothetical protein